MSLASSLTLRVAHENDAATLTRIAIAAKSSWGYSSELLRLWMPQLTITADSIEKRMVVVAEIDGDAVGFGGFDIDTEQPEIDDLWVLPEYQRQGIGKVLFSHFCELGTRQRVHKIVIVSDPNAAGFYQRLGATQIGWHPSVPVGRMLPKFEVALPLNE